MDYGQFLESLDPEQTRIVEYLHASFLDYPEVHYRIRYHIPFYDYRSWICYINPLRKGGVELCFIHGKKLSSHGVLLDSRGRKQVAGVHIQTLGSAPLEEIQDSFAEALILDSERAKKK